MHPVAYKLGKKPARPYSIKLGFRAYADASLPAPPAEFGHDALVHPYHMLGNNKYACCYWSGAAHETYLWTAEGSTRVRITTIDVLQDYASTGFSLTNPGTDQGTDMQQGAAYRQKTGIRDAADRRHKIGAYVSIRAGNVEEHKLATWLFGAVGLGIQIGDNQQEQFHRGVPWDGPPGPNVGGHYTPLLASRGGMLWVVTWGRMQAVTPAFLEAQNDESVAYLSADALAGGKSPEGFDIAALGNDLINIARKG